MPPRLYKYESFSTRSLQNLKGQILYFGSVLGFNDPYDCAVFPSVRAPTAEEIRRYRKEYRESTANRPEMQSWDLATSDDEVAHVMLTTCQRSLDKGLAEFVKGFGVTCFSEKKDDLLMWSHYGGRYRGFCLEFDTSFEPFNRAKPVTYVECFPEVSTSDLIFSTDAPSFEELFRTKSSFWRYECEWRAMHVKAGTECIYPAEALTGVYFGPDMDAGSIEIACLILAGQNDRVTLYRGRRSPREFKVLFEPFTYTNYLEAKRTGKL